MLLDKRKFREREECVAEKTLKEPLDCDVRDGLVRAVGRVVLAATGAVTAAVGDVHVGEIVATRFLCNAAAHNAHQPLHVSLLSFQ